MAHSGSAGSPPGTQATDPAVPDLSIVILCYRAGAYAREFVERMEAALADAGIADYELILVGNYVAGQTDPTPEVVRALARENPRIRALAEPKQGWLGWDVRMGLAAARGRYLAVIDGDGQMPVSDVPIVYAMIRRDRLDLAKTFRVTRGDGLRRRLLSNLYNKVFHLLFPGLRARDMNSKPKILSREAYERMTLVSDDWFIDAEIMIEARRLGLRIGEVPTGFLGLSGRRSFVSAGAVLEFLRNFVRYRLRELRERGPRDAPGRHTGGAS